MRFGAVKYVLPFFFVYNPALVAQEASWLTVLLVSLAALLGVCLIAYALQGYLLGIGPLASTTGGYVVRGVVVVAGVMLAAPEPVTDVIGLALALLTYLALLAAAPLRQALLAPPPSPR
jgi:TRAP-type uncharacterized transport system fused permease subunit